jgi:farnesyl-diphosphate farnesyltransferase
MNDGRELERDVLKGVSRSFYLSLRFLPGPMRKPASIAYLLARASDTIADSAAIPAAERITFLDEYARQVAGQSDAAPWPVRLIDGTPDAREKRLLECHVQSLAAFRTLDAKVISLIRDVVAIIISGQKLDLERFGDPVSGGISALPDDAALDDYAWRVAGCVGEFWTKLGFATLGEGFSKAPESEMLAIGIEYGSGLQLVNILRDLPADLRAGRCYLPVKDSTNEALLLAEFSKWREVALKRVGRGMEYSAMLKSKRLRVASALPAMIAGETLNLLENMNLRDLGQGVRIPRKRVYSLILKAFLRF